MLETRKRLVGSLRWRQVREESMEARSRPGVLAPEVFRAVLEDRARARFDMSLVEFADAFRAGRLDDDPVAFELAVASGASSRRD